MPVKLVIPEIGESVTEAYVGKWLKSEGSHVNKDEVVVVLESEKANFDLPAPVAGMLKKIIKHEGETAKVGEAIGELQEDGAPVETEPPKEKAPAKEDKMDATRPAEKPEQEQKTNDARGRSKAQEEAPGSKKDETHSAEPAPKATEREPKAAAVKPAAAGPGREEESVQMSPMRQTIAKRLVAAQHEAALLTTFNEADMTAVKELRERLRDHFQQQYRVKLGLMSFFVKAAVDALKRFPIVNARIDGDKIVYHNYQDIGIAVSTERGLVVPVLRDADRLGFAQIERAIFDMAERAEQGKLELNELRGGTFTITNGGVFGSLMSTPIVNPPQCAVLGMHTIQDRPVALNSQVVIRPMMYLALSYDHRVIDGKEAVSFLKRIKETIEQPMRMLVEV